MTRNKKILILLAIAFFVMVGIVSYDMAKRTTFPGSKPQLKERLNQQYLQDTLTNPDTTDIKH